MIRTWLVIGACSAAYLGLLFLSARFAGGEALFDFSGALVAWLALWLPWLFLIVPVRRFVGRFPRRDNQAFPRFLAIHLAAFVVLLSLHLVSVLPVAWLMTEREGLPRLAHAFLFERGAFLFDVLVHGALVAASGRRLLQERLLERRHDTLQLSKHLTESRLQTLKMQLNPHFLFNTLNSVSVLVEKGDMTQAQEMIAELCRFLRQTLNSSAEKWVSLEKELETVKHYLAIEKFRFGARLSFHEECEPLALAARIPPMLLQPLFENAIVHGLAEKEGACRLNFECRVHDRRLFMLLSDNGAGFDSSRDPDHGAGIGLANVESRLREIYGDDYSLSLERAYPQGTLVSLKIPAYKDSIHRREYA